ncbi:MAG: peptidoglycan endopeptidase [Castellaniella sp.]|nr:MAG: peptidoglycan endopeptidase [Castellaniella sp.]
MMVLAGCATQPRQTADTSDPYDHLLRDSYLARTQSDPLGAWLKNDDSLTIDYPEDDSQTSASSPVPKTMVSTAMRFLGVKYRFGGDTPKEGFDCSGLVAYAAEKSLGLKLPRSARDQAQTGTSVGRGDLRRGDLVFFNTLGRRYSHVGIYLGDHKFVHAPRSGASIRVDDMDMAYWRSRYNGARRLDVAGGEKVASRAVAQEQTEPSGRTHTSRPAHESRRTRTSKSSHSAKSAHSAKPNRSAKSTHSSRPAHAAKPTHSAKSAHESKRSTHKAKQPVRTAHR